MYRPQFAYRTPPGCRDEEFTYYFDGSNTPLLNQSISNKTFENIPLVLDQDAPFFWRGWTFGALFQATSGGCPPVPTFLYMLGNVGIKLRDCYENNLMGDYTPAVLSGTPMNPLSFDFGLYAGPPVPLEPEIYCPPGGSLLLFLKAPTLLGGGSFFPRISLHGVKRFKDCAQ